MDIDNTIRRVRNEFIEMPGLRLSLPQAMRLWGLGKTECERVVTVLVRTEFLRLTDRGDIIRAA